MDVLPIDLIWSLAKRVVLSDNVLMTLIIAPLLLVAELLRPAHKVPPRHYMFGFAFFAVNAVFLTTIAPVVNYAIALGVQWLGLGLIDLRALGFSGLGGSLFALLVSTFITDFFYYWFHRALHSSPALWQTHLLHHTDEHMNMMTAQRGHFLEGWLSPFFIALPMAILFKVPAVDIALFSLIPYGYQLFVHANIRLSFGPLWWLLISPDYHRIHHSADPKHRDKNFTNWFPVWDILFGTVWHPQRNEYPATGVEGVRVATLAQAYALPFAGWLSMWKARAADHKARLARN